MDEIDAIGERRFSEGTSDDREIQRTLMGLLIRLDGFHDLGKIKLVWWYNYQHSSDATIRGGPTLSYIHNIALRIYASLHGDSALSASTFEDDLTGNMNWMMIVQIQNIELNWMMIVQETGTIDILLKEWKYALPEDFSFLFLKKVEGFCLLTSI